MSWVEEVRVAEDVVEGAGLFEMATLEDAAVVVDEAVGEGRDRGARESRFVTGFAEVVLETVLGAREPSPEAVVAGRDEVGREVAAEEVVGTMEVRRAGGGAMLCLEAR